MPVEPVERAERVEPDAAIAPATFEGAAALGASEAAQPVDAGPGKADGDFAELALASVELSTEGLLPAIGTVSLVPLDGQGQLDIVMARADASLVQEAISGIPPLRPRTHDLLLATVEALGGQVAGVTLVERRAGGVYVANMGIRRPDGTVIEVDARPSDALNVALRSVGAVLRAARSLVEIPAN